MFNFAAQVTSMITLNRKKFLQDLIWHVVKTLRARANYIIRGFVVCSPPESTEITKWGTRSVGHLSRFREMRKIHAFLEKIPRTEQLEDLCVVWGKIKQLIAIGTFLDYI